MLSQGLSAGTLAKLFALSARQPGAGLPALLEKLAVVRSLAAEGRLPFSPDEVNAALDAWQAAGYPPCHHSEAYRGAYAPAYRVLHQAFARFLPLFMAIDQQLAAGQRVILAIDGPCASGKTTLASLLTSVYECPVFHMDDFFLRPEQRTPERYQEPGGNVDRERFATSVLEPLVAGKPVTYAPFHCYTMSLGKVRTVQPAALTVVEGSYCLHPALRDAYTLRVFLTLPDDVQQERILAREGEGQLAAFNSRWIPLEQAYHAACAPEAVCDFVFSTAN